LRVVLVAPRNPLNIGAAARAMSNFGFSSLRLVNPYEVAFREARSAVGASAVLSAACEFQTIEEAIGNCTLVVGTTAGTRRELHAPLRRLEYGARIIRKSLAEGPVALLFGSEKFGLSNEDISHCHWLLRIPSRDEHRSMNLGQAVAVCLYELIRDSRAAIPKSKGPPPAATDQVELFTSLLYEAMERSGYVNPRTASSAKLKLRHLVKRLSLSGKDTFVWLGILRQILWKLGQ
jgi:tRNA/rRNA methyltransferase